MKKVFSTLLVASMFAIVACGPSAEDKAAAEKATQDSITAAEQAQQAAAEQAVMQDSDEWKLLLTQLQSNSCGFNSKKEKGGL